MKDSSYSSVMGNRAAGLLGRAVFIFFLIFLFFLPLYEAPKNIFSVLFVFLGAWVAFIHNNALTRFKSKDPVVWTFLLLAISPFFSGLGSTYLDFTDRFMSALNWALMPLVALVFVSVEFSEEQIVWALRVVCGGTVVGVGQAFFAWTGDYPELNSVGHVNQSALYLAFCIVPAGLLFMKKRNLADPTLAVVTIFAIFLYQGPARSMVGFGACLAFLIGVWIIYWFNQKNYVVLVASLVLGATFTSITVSLPPQSFGLYQGFKIELDYRLKSQNDPFSQRDRLVNTAFEVGRESITGFGLGSFGLAAQQNRVRELVEARGGDWDVERDSYFYSSHGHNLFGNVLVERGWLGIACFSIFILALLIRFSRYLRCEFSQVGILTLAVICLAGLGQSTLHVEHGQLAFICLALCSVIEKEEALKSRENKSARRS